jgi:hypothetical protein
MPTFFLRPHGDRKNEKNARHKNSRQPPSYHLDEPQSRLHISTSTNGLVYAAYHAYSSHHNLALRPDDIWLAILCQTGYFINAHAEDLRHLFVS